MVRRRAHSDEPSLDTSQFRFESGSVEELIQHLKDWVDWRLRQSSALTTVPAEEPVPVEEPTPVETVEWDTTPSKEA